MAIVQISRIQHRRGLSENGPGARDSAVRLQLASAELGWSVDTRQLYIGNGTIEEGAPTIGNTEILTEYSDILNISQTYTYRADSVGYPAQTGIDPSSPVARSLQARLDETINAKSYGAQGNGLSDETSVREETQSLAQALFDLYKRNPVEPMTRRVLRLSPGEFLIGSTLQIPSHAHIEGAGSDRTFIKQHDATVSSVVSMSDVTNVQIAGVTFVNTHNNDVVTMSNVTKARLHDVGFTGSRTTSYVSGPGNACVKLSNVTDANFIECFFKNHEHALIINSDSSSIRITGSNIDDIAYDAIPETSANSVISAFNFYGNVGNNFTSTAVSKVVTLTGQHSASVSDVFTRSASDNVIYPCVSFATASGAVTDNYAVVVGQSTQHGAFNAGSGTVVTLTSGRAGDPTGIELATNNAGARITYTINRGTGVRRGVLTISRMSATVVYTDDYVETSDLGVLLTVDNSSDVAVVKFTNSSGVDATMKYSIEWFN